MSQPDTDLEDLLDYLKLTRGFDFTGYKRGSLERRVAKRVRAVGCSSFAEYHDYLEVHAEEFPALFNTILINVTTFFRDPPAWDVLKTDVIPEFIARRESGVPIRVWSAGCASGEEAYTLAMVFAECVGIEAFKEQVKIYATDADEDALSKARQGTYALSETADVPSELAEKYFEIADGRYTFRKDLRRQIIFGRHDLIQDAPISRVDMLVCRNTLMYFNAETQGKIISRFQFALNDGGVLFLGRAETLMTQAASFAPIDLKRRISRKVGSSNGGIRERLLLLARQPANGDEVIAVQGQLRDVAFDASPTAQLVVDNAGLLAFANERARGLFGLVPSDIGIPLRDLKVSYRPLELRSLLDQVQAERRPILTKDIEWPSVGGDSRWLDVLVLPLVEPLSSLLLGASVIFSDVSIAKRLQRDLEHSNQALETAYEELQSTNEELETTNEELQSTVEELETTNEEIQSTNEELETMNEELQSTNEELQTMNDELRIRSDELNRANGFLDSVLGSMYGAVIVVDADLKVLVWNRAAEDLWGLREEETRAKNVMALDIGLAMERLKQPMRAALSGAKDHISLMLPAVNRRGRSIECRVNLAPLTNRQKSIHGVIIVAEEIAAERPARKALTAKR